MSTSGICGCCGGLSATAPSASFARAGLSAVSLRSGTYWDFRDSLLARLTSSDHGALADLKSRDAGVDFSVALIDAWAVAGDVLTFYNERLASESLLGTAREQQSLHLLADLVAYRPGPGVAASAKLAFTMSEAPGSPTVVNLPSGIKVQSTPGPDEQPVLFETGAAVTARPAWNALRPQLGMVQPLSTGTTTLYLAGVSTGLKAGDALFYTADDGRPVFARIAAVSPFAADPAKDPDRPSLTRLTLSPLATAPLSLAAATPPPAQMPTFAPALASVLGTTLDAAALSDFLAAEGVAEDDLFAPLTGTAAAPKQLLAFRASAGTFGKAAPALNTLPEALIGEVPVYDTKADGTIYIRSMVDGPYANRMPVTWADTGTLDLMEANQHFLFLDRTIDAVAADSPVALVDGSKWGLYQATAVAETAVADFAITGKSTRLTLTSDTGFDQLSIRGTTAFVIGEWIALPLAPIDTPLPVGTTEIALNGLHPGLEPGRLLALTGTLAHGVDATVAEHAEIAAVEHRMQPGGVTSVTLTKAIAHDFDRRALRMNANVVAATHGETRFEILGSGGGRTPFPTFAAKQGPLTHVSAEVPGGGKAELTVRVNGIAWYQVPDLLDAKPADHSFTLALDEQGKPRIGFGDGAAGALPTAGQDNITLDYRTGIGLGGRVKAGQLNMLMTRPLGLTGVTNPLPSEGGADPEAIDALRANLPLFCRTLDRVVSLSDFADFAQIYSGIAKARAERVKVPGLPAPGVALTVAGEKAAAVLPGGDLHGKLHKALMASGIPFSRFQLRDFRSVYFRMAARIVVNPDHIASDVVAAAEKALRAAFGFDTRDFAEAVYDSQVVTVLQQVPGVKAVMLDRLYTGAIPQRRSALAAESATATHGAELLLLHPGPIDYLEAAA